MAPHARNRFAIIEADSETESFAEPDLTMDNTDAASHTLHVGYSDAKPKYYSEKRKFMRMHVEIPLQYRGKNTAGADALPGTTRNLSAGGLCFYSLNPVAIGERLQIWIASFGNLVQPLKAEMHVQRISTDPDGGFLVQGSLFDVC